MEPQGPCHATGPQQHPLAFIAFGRRGCRPPGGPRPGHPTPRWGNEAVKEIDHFMYAGRDMDGLAAQFRALTGIETEPGGAHPGMGTRNHLVGTHTDVYLELIAPDTAQPDSSPLREAFEAMRRPQLHRFIARCRSDEFPALQRAYADAGIDAPVRDMQRVTTTGEVLSWRLMVPDPTNPLGVFAPFFIDWLQTPHPSTRLRQACGIAAVAAGHPDAGRVGALWQALGIGLPLAQADAPYLHVSFDTPRGIVVLTSAD